MKTVLIAALSVGALLVALETGTAAEKHVQGKRKAPKQSDLHFGRTLREWRAQLQSDNEFLRRYAARVLGQIGPKAIPALIVALKHTDSSVRYWAAVGLGNIGPKARGAVPMLTRALEDPSAVVRIGVAMALWRIRQGREDLQALIDALKDDSDTVRLLAVHALARIGPAAKQAVPMLNEALKDKYRYVVQAAKQALRDIEGTQ